MNGLEAFGFAFIVFIVMATITAIWIKCETEIEKRKELCRQRIEGIVSYEILRCKRKEKDEIDLRFRKMEHEIMACKEIALSKITFADWDISESIKVKKEKKK